MPDPRTEIAESIATNSQPQRDVVSRVLNADPATVQKLARDYDLVETHKDWEKNSFDKGPWDQGHWANRR